MIIQQIPKLCHQDLLLTKDQNRKCKNAIWITKIVLEDVHLVQIQVKILKYLWSFSRKPSENVADFGVRCFLPQIPQPHFDNWFFWSSCWHVIAFYKIPIQYTASKMQWRHNVLPFWFIKAVWSFFHFIAILILITVSYDTLFKPNGSHLLLCL